MRAAFRRHIAFLAAFLCACHPCIVVAGDESSLSCVDGDDTVCSAPETSTASGGSGAAGGEDTVEGSADENLDQDFSIEDMKHYQEEGARDDELDDSSAWTSNNFVPVFIIPSLAGTRLRTWSRFNCGPLAQFNVGGTVWYDLKRMLSHTTCWIDCLKLRPVTYEDDNCMARPDEGLDAISVVDESLPTGGFLLKALIHMFVSLGYEPDQSMFAHPYDWRLPPGLMESRDAVFSRLKNKIENAVQTHKRRNPENPARGVVLVGLSLGNMFIQYFFEYLRAELGTRGMERWADEYVHGLVMGGAPWLGAGGPVKSVVVGETMGMPWTKEQSRDLFTTWGIFPWMFPYDHKTNDPRHAAMNHDESDFPARVVEVQFRNGTTLLPDNKDIIQDGGFFGQMGPNLDGLQQTIDRWYIDDPVIGGGSPLRPFTPPKGIDNIVCAYGVNVPTEVGFKFREHPDKDGFWELDETILNDGGDIRDTSGNFILPRRRRFAARKSGDGSVPYYSLSWCHSWFGQGAVNITKVPAHRQYEEEEVEAYTNVDVMDKSQFPAPGEKTSHNFNTFFSQTWFEDHPDTGLQRRKSIQVWEMDGIIHKDTVTDKRVTRLFEKFIGRSEKMARMFVRIRRRMIRKAREEVEKSGLLDENMMDQVAREGAHLNYDNIPTTDGECYWDYYNMQCAWTRYCEYSFKLGDLHLTQSCRLRDSPLAKDDPRLLKRVDTFNETLNVSSNDGWRIIYRDMDRSGLIPPFVYVTLAFLGGFITLFSILYAAYHLYRDSFNKALGYRSTEQEAQLRESVKILHSAVKELEAEMVSQDRQDSSDSYGASSDVCDEKDQDVEPKVGDLKRRVQHLTRVSMKVSQCIDLNAQLKPEDPDN
uniref:Uncharacterized protein n=1 Tax=Odontella aurita TaxID=265563 RepID=A0A7S4MS34_9STRA